MPWTLDVPAEQGCAAESGGHFKYGKLWGRLNSSVGFEATRLLGGNSLCDHNRLFIGNIQASCCEIRAQLNYRNSCTDFLR
jgi:hypothetical protein